jgi:2',3'-cyclic-nucleotide 2'-phosphodiesterase
MTMKVLMVGDVVGSPGRSVFAQVATRLKARGEADFVIVNAENAAGGKGITEKIADELFAAGADVITLGDHTWNQKETARYLDRAERVLRPANFAPGCPGRGLLTVPTPFGAVSVINLIGRVFMAPYDCPFRCVDALLSERAALGRLVIVDMHAEATSEKIVMGRYLDGRVSVVAGTHTHVQTSDEVILPGGTAYLTDLGMTGVKDSAIGRDLDSVVGMFLTGMPAKFDLARGAPLLEGMLVSIDDKTGRARSIKRLREGADGPARSAIGV